MTSQIQETIAETRAYRPAKDKDKLDRLAKRIADLGYCSRRDAEELITQSRVKVNSEIVTDCATLVGDKDFIEIDDKKIRNKIPPLKVYLFHKPVDYITTNKDPQDRPTIFDIIPARLGRLITVGRLDFKTEGLLILTNNGDFASKMELPSSGAKREYRVRVRGNVDIKDLYALKDGITIDGVEYGKVLIEYDKAPSEGTNFWLKVAIFEGKNREIRKIMDHFNLEVSKLIRITYGKYHLGKIPVGCIIEADAQTGLRDLGMEKDEKFKKPDSWARAKPRDNRPKKTFEKKDFTTNSNVNESNDSDNATASESGDDSRGPGRPFTPRDDRPRRSFDNNSDRRGGGFGDRQPRYESRTRYVGERKPRDDSRDSGYQSRGSSFGGGDRPRRFNDSKPEGETRQFDRRDGDSRGAGRPFTPRDDRPRRSFDNNSDRRGGGFGDRKPYPSRNGGSSFGDRKPYQPRGEGGGFGDRKPYPQKDGDRARRPYPAKSGFKPRTDRPSFTKNRSKKSDS
jgi:23S rRNA pseudouridine2605 synthase